MKKFTLITAGFFLGLLSLQAQTTCSNDRVAYVNSKNTGTIGAYTLSVGAEEKAAQTYHYSGPGNVGGARVYGTVPSGLGVVLKVSLYNVDANDRPTGAALATAPLKEFFTWSPAYFDVSFSPAVAVNANFAVVVEVVHYPGWGHDFALAYTGNSEGLAEDLASLAGTSTGFNWASAMTAFNKDGDFYIYPRMTNFNTPHFATATQCIATGGSVAFTNETEMTIDPMFNQITAPGYNGTAFLYSWNFGDGSPVSHVANPTHTYATAGVYTVVLTSTIDGWDGVCTKTYSKQFSVGLSADATSIVNVTCNGGSNGSMVATAAGGATPYVFGMNGETYVPGNAFGGLSAGTYHLYVQDALGCVKEDNFMVSQPAPISFTSATATTATCGNADGGLLVASTGGVSPVQYQLNSGNFQSGGSFANLSAGSYVVTVKDANGCTNSVNSIVNDLGGPGFNVVNHTNVSCFDDNDGSISLSSLGGTGAIQYSIDGTNFQTSGTFANLTAGNYTVIVKDATGCSDISIITIAQPEELAFTLSTVALTCFESNDGQINVGATSGGIGAITYSLDGVNFQSGTNFPGLAAGNYVVHQRDVAGCTNQLAAIVTQPNAITATVSTIAATCHDNQNGSISITANGGTAPYQYGIEDNARLQQVGTFDDLAAGTYTLLVTDQNGCTYQTTGTIAQPSAIVPATTSTNATCGNANGGLLATATGGSGSGYTYSLNAGTFGAGSFSGLVAGSYVVTVKDGAGCTAPVTVSVFDSNGPSILTSSHTNVNCHGGNDGTITVGTVSGGTGVLQYSINGTAYQTANVFTQIPAGQYNVTVKDAVGCIGNTIVTITEPNAFVMTATTTNVLCNGGNTGSAALLVGGGSGPLAYSIDGGTTYQSGNTFSNITAGWYTLIVKDAGGCLGYKPIVVTQPPAITALYNSLNVTCNGDENGAIYAYAYGGTAPLQFSLNGLNYQASGTFTGLTGGQHDLYVSDANGCSTVIPATVHEPSALSVSGTISDVTCAGGNNGVIDQSITGGTSGYMFDWSNGADSEDNFNLAAGTYTVLVSDENGCSTMMSYTIGQPATPVVVNGTVVNSTGTNDGSIDITVTGGGNGYSFLWSNGATSGDLSNLDPGTYTVTVTDVNGCSASSTFIVENTLGIDETQALSHAITVYPNPATSYVIIQVNGAVIDQIELFDPIGKLVFSGKPANSLVEIATSELQQGTYFAKVLVNGQLITKKINVIK